MLQKVISCLIFLICSAAVPLRIQIQNAYNLIPDTCSQPLICDNLSQFNHCSGVHCAIIVTVCLNRCTFLKVVSLLQPDLLGSKHIIDNHRMTMEETCAVPNLAVSICLMSSHITFVTLLMLLWLFFLGMNA